MLEVTKVEDLKDGGAKIHIELDGDEFKFFFRRGLNGFLKDHTDAKVTVEVSDINWDTDELSKEIFEKIATYGLQQALIEHIERLKDEEKDQTEEDTSTD